jgi:hypothetical protein
VAAAWAAGALVERLRTLAVSAAHRVDVQRHGAHPYVVRWSLHREPTAGSDS